MPRASKASHAAAVKAAGHATSGGNHTTPAKATARVIVQANRQVGDPAATSAWRMTPVAPGTKMDRFSHLNFPDYHFREFPKWVTPKGGKAQVVQNAAEEELVLGGAEIVREEDERARLVLLAEVKGVQVDNTWPLEKLEKAIADAGHDPSLDPSA